tara:strand:+ start:183 stop:542 length:360 start_codon:yes stop_codon:yes gene_type:complete
MSHYSEIDFRQFCPIPDTFNAVQVNSDPCGTHQRIVPHGTMERGSGFRLSGSGFRNRITSKATSNHAPSTPAPLAHGSSLAFFPSCERSERGSSTVTQWFMHLGSLVTVYPLPLRAKRA